MKSQNATDQGNGFAHAVRNSSLRLQKGCDVMEITVKELAERERVNERTVRRWIAKGAVDVRRTPGGGIRVVERRTGAVFFDMTNADKSGHPST